ncbi:MAG: cupin domain-containing protein [Dongiaceae bacterium]
MKETLHFKRAEMQFDKFGGPPGAAEISRLVGPDISKTMGVGIAKFDECSIEWTVLYDEMIVVLEGEFRLRLGDRLIAGTPGDVIWIPENTPLRYEGKGAVVCYALYPVDWRARHNL